jgi:hypothetical protein
VSKRISPAQGLQAEIDEVFAGGEDLAGTTTSGTSNARFECPRATFAPDRCFNRTRDAIEAHLTIVFTALAVAHNIQERTCLAIANVIKQLRPLRSATIAINDTTETFPPEIPAPQRKIMTSLGIPEPGH